MSSEIFAEMTSLSSQGLLVVASGADPSIVYANPAYEAMSGYRLADLEGSNWLAHAAADEESPDVVRLRQHLALDELHQQSMPFLRKDGDIWFAALKLIPLKAGADGRKLWLVEHPVTSGAQGASAELLKRALGRARRKLASLDRTDPVTGLMAHEHFEMLLRHELAIARRESAS